MIRINLLPSDGGKRSAASGAGSKRVSSGPSPAPFYLLLALLYAGALTAGWFVYSTGADVKRQVAEASNERDKLKADVQKRQAEFEANNLRSQEIEEKYAVIAALGPENRVFWSEKVNMIAMARLNLAVYVTKIELQEQIDEKETEESVRRREDWKRAKEKDPKLATPEPQPVKQPVINQTLKINAIAYGNDSSQRLTQIRLFMNNLTTLEWKRQSGETARFMDRMSPEIVGGDQVTDVVAGVEVVRFTLDVKAEPQLDRTMAEDDATSAPGLAKNDAPGTATIEGKKAAVEETMK